MARLQYQARAEPLEPTLIASLDWFQQASEPVRKPERRPLGPPIVVLEPTLFTAWELDWFQPASEPVLAPVAPTPPSLAFVWEPTTPSLIFPIDLKVYADPMDPIIKIKERARRLVVELATEAGRTGPQHAAVLWWQAWLGGLFLPAFEPLRHKPARASEKRPGEIRRALQRTQWQIDKLGKREDDVEERLEALANAIIDIRKRLES